MESFHSWCLKRASESTCSQYVRKVREILSGEASPDKSRWHVTAWKRFARYRCEEHGEKWWCEEFQRWKSIKSRADIYVPSDEEVLEALRSPEPLATVYRLLVESGLRLREVLRIASEDLKVVRLEGFVRVELAWA